MKSNSIVTCKSILLANPVLDAMDTKMTKTLFLCSQGTKSMGDIYKYAHKCISMLWVEIQRGRLNKRGKFKA